MFPYWSAPPSVLREWARPQDAEPALDDKVHLSTLAVRAGEGIGSLLSRINCSTRAFLTSRAADSQPSPC
jgi:hypothetical protein